MKKLIIFLFSAVLLGSCGKEGCTDIYSVDYNADATKDDGSCSDQRIVKFSIEVEDDYVLDGPVFAPSNPNATKITGEFTFEYSSLGIQTTENLIISQSLNGNSVLYLESDPLALQKYDNVSVRFEFSASHYIQEINARYLLKAHINNEEIIIWDESFINPNGSVVNLDEQKNWPVP